MPGRRTTVLIAATSAVGIAALVAARLFVFPPVRLGPATGTTTGQNEAHVGQRLNVFIGGFNARGRDPVRVRDVRVTGVPRGLRVVGVHALHRGPNAGTRSGDLQQQFPGVYTYRPVTDMVFHPGRPEEWTIVIVIEATERGEWHTTGLEVAWTSGWYRGTTHYDYRVGMRVEHGP